MPFHSRLPALPLVVNDPYFSVWLPGDRPTDAETIHWSGVRKPLRGYIIVDGSRYRFLGKDGVPAAQTLDVIVTPLATILAMQAGAVRLNVTFWSPALPDDLDALSTPITFVDFEAVFLDNRPHSAEIRLDVSDHLCYDGESRPELYGGAWASEGVHYGYMGQKKQHVLGHSGDHITMDWGYLWAASAQSVEHHPHALSWAWTLTAAAAPQRAFLALGYDDVAAIQYFGTPCRAWYQRHGCTLHQALADFARRHDAIWQAACAWDARIMADARRAGGEEYAQIVSAAWRQTFAAHKLIATPSGDMALLSKENDSGGCIGTVDVSYPTVPVLLKYCPELVNALLRPILEYASMPVWGRDFAPHDVGFYPYATGQVYGLRTPLHNGDVVPPLYLYPSDEALYDDRFQMPVEECGNMLIMLEAALSFGASDALARRYAPLLDKWVVYLDRYGDDPGEQLCTDDFAGHLAHNVNLSAKAVVGVACYARLKRRLGDEAQAARWKARARAMADGWLRCAGKGATPLTFDGEGWSMKYNLAWDLVLDLGLLPERFYCAETASYLPRMNRYGLPLDSRADYTKSDWLAWCAAMARDIDTRRALLHPQALYLRESATRVPFSDWYDTYSGDFVQFIARSVQGGLFMPMLVALDASPHE